MFTYINALSATRLHAINKKMDHFITLSYTYYHLNKEIHEHRNSAHIKDHVHTIIQCLEQLPTESVNKQFSDECTLVANKLKSLGADTITPHYIKQVWEQHDIHKLIKHGRLIFTPWDQVELIAKKASLTEKDWKLVYKCLEYNTLMMEQKQKGDGPSVAMDPRAEYLLRHSEEIVRDPDQLKEIMSYPVSYVATPVMVQGPSKYNNGPDASKKQLYEDLCELYAASLMINHWVADKDNKLNALLYFITVTRVKTILPMQCRYISSNHDASFHLYHISSLLQSFIDDPDNVLALSEAGQHMINLAHSAGIDWKDVRARYEQTNVDYNHDKQQEQQEQEEEVGIDDLPSQPMMIEVAGKHHSHHHNEEDEEEEEHHHKKKKGHNKKKGKGAKKKHGDKHRS